MDDDSIQLLQQDGRHVIVFGGPNGSGKTSLIDQVKQTGLRTVSRVYPVPERFINPDQVAKDLQGDFADQHARDVAAARAAVVLRRQAIESRKPFAFETVMSHTARISELLTLKEQGYHVVLTFITTDDPEKNVSRVRLRYETCTTTGHYVPPGKVRDRYKRTLDLLPKAAEIADAIFVYDNSVDYEQATLQALIDGDAGLSVIDSARDWVHERLVKPLQEREQEVQELVREAERRKLPLVETDELRGRYWG
ncbi:zeta toxin family protein [Massilia sp. DJPM01]|uniref:zeta toxin family protein n=1 Tax=Massilia sp. DJPM01 TaxID=3024404 RepID=UPI00259E0106|nr:zeta toxin family protein [Massilia sp. DJPM01]MDM5181962.1 zeta toxin family protein [Massilia sp. DJPM01]